MSCLPPAPFWTQIAWRVCCIASLPTDSVVWVRHHTRYNPLPPFVNRSVLAARQSPAIHEAAVAILGTNDILVNHDRYGLFRPTVDVVDAAGNALGDMVGWRTRTNLHLDMSPWAYLDDDPGYGIIESVWPVVEWLNPSDL